MAAGGRRGLVLDGWLVGFESGWSRSEVERDIESYIFLKSKNQNEMSMGSEAVTGEFVGRRRPATGRGVSRGSGAAKEVVGRGRRREK